MLLFPATERRNYSAILIDPFLKLHDTQETFCGIPVGTRHSTGLNSHLIYREQYAILHSTFHGEMSNVSAI